MVNERTEYAGEGLAEGGLAATPLDQVRSWVDAAAQAARAAGPVAEPDAMSVATVDAQGRPNVRTVLMRFLDARGPGFVSSTDSAKGAELAANPVLAASLTWPGLYRAIRFRGPAERIGADEVGAYWVSRPWGSRISAWASTQSAPVASRAELEAAYERYAARWPDRGRPDDVPVPDTWAGWRVVPDEVELWAGRRDRLHDRLAYLRTGPGGLDDPTVWRVVRRQP